MSPHRRRRRPSTGRSYLHLHRNQRQNRWLHPNHQLQQQHRHLSSTTNAHRFHFIPSLFLELLYAGRPRPQPPENTNSAFCHAHNNSADKSIKHISPQGKFFSVCHSKIALRDGCLPNAQRNNVDAQINLSCFTTV